MRRNKVKERILRNVNIQGVNRGNGAESHGDHNGWNSQGKVLVRRELHRINAPEICRGPRFEYSTEY